MDFTTNKEKLEEKLLKAKTTDNVDLNALYEHGHSELSLQQSKRDQIITLYRKGNDIFIHRNNRRFIFFDNYKI